MSESLRHCFKDIGIEGSPIEKEIAENTEKYRKGNFNLRLPANKRVERVKVKQVKHAFNFGCNTFMLEGFAGEEQNREYEEKFVKLFNLGLVGTFWKDYEPQKGAYRFDKDSPFVHRRPPIDTALEFCQKNRLTVKAHNLIWHRDSMHPDWVQRDKQNILPDIFDYFEALANRYGDCFKYIDVANEHTCRGLIGVWGNDPMPRDYVYEVYKKADQLFPNSKLLTNENHMGSWVEFCQDSSAYYLYLKSLLASGCRVDEIGMQYHAFISEVHEERFGLSMMNLADLDSVLKYYESFEKPIQISEVTIPSTLFGEKVDEGLQREITENLVRLWFSHPQVNSVIWWNFSDGTAYEDEDKYKGALLGENLAEKPVYHMLDRLINQEWHTEQTIGEIRDNACTFRGFYGEYDVELLCAGGAVETVRVVLDEDNKTVSL